MSDHLNDPEALTSVHKLNGSNFMIKEDENIIVTNIL
jgi:hypothetical protein